MIRNIFSSVICVAVTLVSTQNVSAAYVTSNGTLQIRSDDPDPDQTGANPPLTEITQLSSGSGRVFTNQVNGSTPFELGSTIRSVGTTPIVQAINGDNLEIQLPDESTFTAIFAIEGEIVAGAGGLGAVARFTKGSVFLASRSTGNGTSFDRDNPLSWNFDNVFAKFDLAPAMTILPGGGGTFLVPPTPPVTLVTLPSFGVEGGAVFAPGSSVNTSAANSPTVGNDGIFVFEEDSTFTPGAGFEDPDVEPFVGDQFLRDVERVGGPFFEGIAAFTDQTLNPNPITLSSTELGELDRIALAAGLGGDFQEGGYDPSGLGLTTGDFDADLSSENYIITVVPEPSSLLLLGVGIGTLAWFRRRQGSCVV